MSGRWIVEYRKNEDDFLVEHSLDKSRPVVVVRPRRGFSRKSAERVANVIANALAMNDLAVEQAPVPEDEPA